MLVLLFFTFFSSAIAYTKSTAECGGCMMLINELEELVRNVNTHEKVEVGSFRISPTGDVHNSKKISYARSEAHLHEVLDSACEKHKKYQFTLNLNNNHYVYLNKDRTHLYGILDSSRQSKLNNACMDLIDSHDEVIIKFMQKESLNPAKEFCYDQLKLCDAADFAELPQKPEEEPKNEEEADKAEL